jgi:2-amino-4-hydroxy-6-hydroxymethyldihydropteridine diphosphokinase
MNQAPAARVFIALGSNIDPAARLQQAARALKEIFPDVRFSRCYRNPAFGFDGPDFINGVAGFSTALPISSVLRVTRDIESRCGREPEAPKWAPRAMDLDLLLYGERIGSGPGYTLPRPDLLKRVYMLGPMAQLAPQLRYPPSGPTIGELWAQFPQAQHPLVSLDLDLNAI